jgi:ABC-type phosphate/phosphonate transport system substrate-binding protein
MPADGRDTAGPIASLPMYLRSENRAVTDAFWAATRDALRDRGIEAPEALDHDASLHAAWSSPGLVLSQICNLPYRLGFDRHVTLVAAPDHRLPDTPPGHYHSALVIRADDPRETLAEFDGATIAINGADSQSGWGAPAAAAALAGIAFGAARPTGAHVESARAVAERRADIAGIDAVTWEMIRRWDGFAKDLRVLARTPPTPALAYVTAAGTDPEPLRAALTEALATLPADARTSLGVHAILPPDPPAYARLPVPELPPA